ncbi:3'-5' exonuclease [Candidatus Gottesmanbacteria bacterium]|nr:3'-5' exonuclease [Candidatus Gottesmanbacteria bacterium]
MQTRRSELYISVDIEASGPIPGEFSILSLGACVVGQPSKTFYAELKPINDNFIDKALKVSGLSLEDLKTKGEEPAQAMARFERWIKDISGESRPIFVGFNATFDWMFTHWYFMKFLGRNPFGISGLDIKAYYMGMKNVGWGQTTKKYVRAQFQPATQHTHHALDDAKEQAEIFEKMLRARPSR